MNRTPSKLYLDYPADTVSVLTQSIATGLQAANNKSGIPIYFRADDIGVISNSFVELLTLFSHHNIPLCLAIVPTWLSKPRWSVIAKHCDISSDLWCWHQHGWNHKNHQRSGKNCEFGTDRTRSEIEKNIVEGRDRLRQIVGPQFSPFFTPPWNRCSDITIDLLKDSGFKAISRDLGSKQSPMQPLPDLPISVDLHTRKEEESQSCLLGLASELDKAARNGSIGIMIHHQRMNKNAFHMLDKLLQIIPRNTNLKPVHFGNMT